MLIHVVKAQAPPLKTIEGATDITSAMIYILGGIMNAMFWILMILSVIFVLWGAYEYLTSGGDETKVHNATRRITYAAVAIIVALIAGAFPNLIASIFGITDLSGPFL